MTSTGKGSHLNGTGKKKEDTHEEEEHEEHVPCWLQWTLAFLIVSNILAYFLVTWSTIKELNKQIEVLKSRQSSSLLPDITTTTDWNMGKKVLDEGERSASANDKNSTKSTEASTLFTLKHVHQANEIFKVTIGFFGDHYDLLLLMTG